MSRIYQPDGFAIGLFGVGLVALFLPLLVMPGWIAMLAPLLAG